MPYIAQLGLSTLLTSALIPLPGLAPSMRTPPAKSAKASRPKAPDAKAAPAVAPAAWRAMVDRDVVAVAADGTLVAGRLAGYDGETATLVDRQGVVRTIVTRDVTELRAALPANAEGPDDDSAGAAVYGSEKERTQTLERKYGHTYTEGRGTGRLIAGGLLVAAGAPQIIAGFAVLVLARRQPEVIAVDDMDNGAGYRYEDNPKRASLTAGAAALLTFGLAHFAVGIPLLVTGRKRRERYSTWLEERASTRERAAGQIGGKVHVAPAMGRIQGGWTAGLRLQF